MGRNKRGVFGSLKAMSSSRLGRDRDLRKCSGPAVRRSQVPIFTFAVLHSRCVRIRPWLNELSLCLSTHSLLLLPKTERFLTDIFGLVSIENEQRWRFAIKIRSCDHCLTGQNNSDPHRPLKTIPDLVGCLWDSALSDGVRRTRRETLTNRSTGPHILRRPEPLAVSSEPRSACSGFPSPSHLALRVPHRHLSSL